MTPFNSAIDLPPAPIKVSHLLAGLIPVNAVAYETHSLDTPYPLMAEEAAYVATSVPKRFREFSAGRACARAALRELQIEDFPIRPGEHREPIWPKAVTGSITHTRGYAGAVVVSKGDAKSVGIDAEHEGSVGEDLWREICSSLELKWLHGLPADTACTAASIIFSAKEAFYKAQFPLTGEWLDFHDVQISIGDRGFRLSPRRALQLKTTESTWEGRFHVTGGLVLTAICIR